MNKPKRRLKTMLILLAVALISLLTCACDSFGNGISKEDLPSGTYYTTGKPFCLGFSKLEFFDDHVLLYYGESRKDDNTIITFNGFSDEDQRKTGTYYGVYDNVKKYSNQETVNVQGSGSKTEITIKIQSAETNVDQTTLEDMKNMKLTAVKFDDGDVTLTQEYGDGEIFETFTKQ